MPRQRRDTRSDLPSTLGRSDEYAPEIWQAAHDCAVDTYGEGERAHRVAFAALKHSDEKVGDHWEAKERPGPSDERAASGGPDGHGATTAGGVDARASVAHLREVAGRLGVKGRSRMRKAELVTAIEKANRRATARARGD